MGELGDRRVVGGGRGEGHVARIPDEGDVPRAVRLLADYDYLHTRYYGDASQRDFHISLTTGPSGRRLD